MVKNCFIGFLCFLSFQLKGSHIVGGEFELKHQFDYSYYLYLTQYFDDINGRPGAQDVVVKTRIYSKSTNELMDTVLLILTSDEFVPYTNIECTIEELATRRLFYVGNVKLPPDKYNDKYGYYIVFDRCCRNRIINNILKPNQTGNAFYLEFPPVVKDGKQFINSSPRLFPPIGDYACVNDLFYFDFGGEDPDGDSLVYSMAHPLAGYSNPNSPVGEAQSAPYPRVLWANGIKTEAAIPGDPPLSITPAGLLTVKPTQVGLFVFSVICTEYRDGVRIGLVQRDFQIFVIDCPASGKKPVLMIKDLEGDTYSNVPDTFFVSNRAEQCLEFVVKDADGQENLSFRADPVNFSADFSNNFNITSGDLKDAADSITFEFCLPDCQYTVNPHVIDIIAGDDACPLPLLDTVQLIIYIESPPNQPAYFVSPENAVLNYKVDEGENIDLLIRGRDEDDDYTEFMVYSPDFDPESFNMTFDTLEFDPGNILVNFSWQPDCGTLDFSEDSIFQLFLLLDDIDYCRVPEPDTLSLNIQVILPQNQSPELFSDLGSDSASVKLQEILQFNLIATDPDNDLLHLQTLGTDFNLTTSGFSPIDIQGEGSITKVFTWAPECGMFDSLSGDALRVFFLLDDSDACNLQNADTLVIDFYPLEPDNNPPILTTPDITDLEFEVFAGDSINITLTGLDLDEDSLRLYVSDGSNQIERIGAEFEPAKGKSKVKTYFSWNTDCRHLTSSYSDVVYNFTFALEDDKCFSAAADAIDLSIRVKNKDINTEEVFIPNVFTPNNDGTNEFFHVLNLPEDNCRNQFIDVSIYNRYGKRVFFSRDRDFRWNADNVVSGVYYYHVNFSEKDYDGYVNVFY